MEITMVDDVEGQAKHGAALVNPELDGLMDIELQDILKEARAAKFDVTEVLDALTRAIARTRSEHELTAKAIDHDAASEA
jgi:hypothetical protein